MRKELERQLRNKIKTPKEYIPLILRNSFKNEKRAATLKRVKEAVVVIHCLRRKKCQSIEQMHYNYK